MVTEVLRDFLDTKFTSGTYQCPTNTIAEITAYLDYGSSFSIEGAIMYQVAGRRALATTSGSAANLVYNVPANTTFRGHAISNDASDSLQQGGVTMFSVVANTQYDVEGYSTAVSIISSTASTKAIWGLEEGIKTITQKHVIEGGETTTVSGGGTTRLIINEFEN